MTPRIRPARADDLPRLAAIEHSAAVPGEAGLAPGGRRDATPLAVLDLVHAAGTLWVAADATDQPVGLLAAGEVDGALHVVALAVARDHQRRGLGSALLDGAIDHARWAYHPAVSLTATRDLPWSGRLLAKRGFLALRTPDLSPGLAAALRADLARGHDPTRRIAMAKRL